MTSKRRVVLSCVPLIGLVVVVAGAACVWSLVQRDVGAVLAPGSPDGVEVVFSGVHLSASHGVRIDCVVRGHAVFNAAQWRLWPFREVMAWK